MKKVFHNATLLLLWLVLCVLFLSGCHATAPAAALSELSPSAEAVERTFLECLYLFVGTDYGEFCALVACAMAAHVLFLLRQHLYPWLLDKAPRLAKHLKLLAGRLLSLFKKGEKDNISLPNDLFSTIDESDGERTEESDSDGVESTHPEDEP